MFVRGDQSSSVSSEGRGDLAPDPAEGPLDADSAGASAGASASDHATDFAHHLRNRLFALSALFDVLELRGADSPVVERYLPHLRLELGRLEAFAEEWQGESLAPAPAPRAAGLNGSLAAAIGRVAEHASLRGVVVSLTSEPGAARALRRPALVTAALALLLDEIVRAVPSGTHAWLAVGRSERGETTVALFGPGALPLAGTGYELARAALLALGGDLEPGAAAIPGATPVAGPAAPLAIARLGAQA